MAIDSSLSGKILVGVSTGKIILYELSRDKPMQVIKTIQSTNEIAITSIKFLKKSNCFAVADQNGFIRFFGDKTGRILG